MVAEDPTDSHENDTSPENVADLVEVGVTTEEVRRYDPAPSSSDSEARVERKSFAESGSPEYKRMELGWVGRFVGGGEEKAGNIALLTIIFAMIILFVVILIAFFTQKELPYAHVLVTGVISITTAALGYVCGTKKSND